MARRHPSTIADSLRTDVLVIGAGGAGQRAALGARALGMDVVIATKGLAGRSGNTPMGRFSFCVTQNHARNNHEVHIRDTLESGAGISDKSLVEAFVSQAPERLSDLLSWRMRFEKQNGELKQVCVPGHSEARALHFRQETGLEVTRTMRRQVSRAGIQLLEDRPVVAIAVADGAVSGAIAVDIWTGRPIRIDVPAIVIAAGGTGCLYRETSNAKDSTGDSYALAYGAGAELVDMEMTQFLPVGLIRPASLRGCTDPGGALITAGAWLMNSQGERFMERYDPKRMEFSTRSTITRAIAHEVLAGRGSPSGGVWLQLPYDRGVASKIIDRTWVDYMIQGGVHPDAGPLEVAPSCHYMMGGIRVNAEAESTVQGLFAAGEAMGGLHGANRLAGHGLVEGQVFGALAGVGAARIANAIRHHRPSMRSFDDQWGHFRAAVCAGSASIQPWEIKKEIADVMDAGGGYIRTASRMQAALEKVSELEETLRQMEVPPMGYALQEAIEARHLLITARVVLCSALQRKETRGAHLRLDYPDPDDNNFLAHLAVFKANDGTTTLQKRHVT